MNDYWNDPPETPEPPECCGDYMDIDTKGACVCGKCGKRIEPDAGCEPELGLPGEPWTEESDRLAPMGAKCPHGNPWFDCNACAAASDFAYDAAREQRR